MLHITSLNAQVLLTYFKHLPLYKVDETKIRRSLGRCHFTKNSNYRN